MGKVYESTKTGVFPPKIRFTGDDGEFRIGTWFVGTKLSEKLGKVFKDAEGKDKPANKVFTFAVHDASENLRIEKKNEQKEWKPFPLDVDQEAELNGNTQLDDKLGQVSVGQRIKVTYLGKKKNPKGGKAFNDYLVEDAE